VCTVAAKDMGARAGPHLFRTYPVRENKTYNCTIWEASRATSAAPTFFKRVIIGPPGEEEEFLDGGVGYNNPIKQVIEEAHSIFPRDRRVACIVSIGTGRAGVIRFNKANLAGKLLPVELIKALKSLATDSDKVAEGMEKKFEDASAIYYRLTVDRGLEDISLEEWDKFSEVSVYTREYMKLNKISSQIDSIAKALIASRSAPVGGSTALARFLPRAELEEKSRSMLQGAQGSYGVSAARFDFNIGKLASMV
jgi:predicted acylesterase/phospholipase RssA